MKFIFDLFPLLLFFAAYKLYDIYVATATAIVASLLQVAIFYLRHRRFETAHIVTLGLLVVFGGLTILLHDKQWLMWKPTVLNGLFALVFLASHFIGKKTIIERIMGGHLDLPKNVFKRLNISWAVFFMALALANIAVADRFFKSSAAWIGAAELSADADTEKYNCATDFIGEAKKTCLATKAAEDTWVEFKVFWILGLTLIFVILQSFYLTRYMPSEDPVPKTEL